MKREMIVVYDERENPPKVHSAYAWCVGGDTGVFALFPDPLDPRLFYEAHGDDGHWWVVGRYSNRWAKEIIEAYKEIQE